MNRLRQALALALALTAGACAKSAEKNEAAAPAGSSRPAAVVSSYDSGPRAAESPVDETMAERGEKLFKDKGCSACHGFGQRVSGPDLKGVAMRRTAQWMEQQILHPEKMTKEDPISRQLFAQFALQMPNQGLTEDEAKAIIEYFKHKDHEGREAEN
jgi:mono/diheme cytochrome c family protein